MSTIKKVLIEELLNALNDLYGSGVDYVDICADSSKNRISLIVAEEYLCEKSELINVTTKLSSEDLNQLL